jgi:hypothetical protein
MGAYATALKKLAIATPGAMIIPDFMLLVIAGKGYLKPLKSDAFRFLCICPIQGLGVFMGEAI